MNQADVRTRPDAAASRGDARSMAERLAIVEAQARRMRWGSGVALLVIAAAFLAVRFNPGGIVVARSFIVVDDDGRTRAIFTAHDNDPSLTIIDDAGVARAAFRHTGLVLADAKSQPRAQFHLPADATAAPHVKLSGEGGTILLRPGGGSGAPTTSITGLQLSRPGDPTSGALLALPAGGGPGIELTDLSTHSRTLFTLTPDGAPRLVLFDQDGRQTFATP